MNSSTLSRLSLGLALATALSGCVVKTPADKPAGDPLQGVERFASTGEALETVSAAGTSTASAHRRALSHHKDLLEDVQSLRLDRPDDPLLQHQEAYLARTVEFYREQLELTTRLEDASVENRPGLVSQLYGSQRMYLDDVVDLNQDLEFPSIIGSPIAVGPAAGPILVEEDLGEGMRLNEAELSRLYGEGSYQELVAMVSEAMNGDETLSRESRALYALSLAEEGLLTEAVAQASRLSAEPIVSPELMDARLGESLWLMATGNWPEAEGVLRALEADSRGGDVALAQGRAAAGAMLSEMASSVRDSRLVDARRAMELESFREARRILEALLVSDAPQDVKKRGEVLLGQMSTTEDDSFERRLAEVRGLLSMAGGQSQAKVELDALMEDFPSPRYESRLKAIEAEVEGSSTATEIDHMEQLALAQSLLTQDRYEEAAEAYYVLYGSPVSDDARVGRERAVELYVHKVREDTARDYLEARRIQDADKRLAALGAIYTKLEGVSARYPDSSMIPKLSNHMEVVKQNILILDPGYFDGAEDGG